MHRIVWKMGPKTQAWLAVSNDKKALVTGKYFYHQKERQFLAAAGDVLVQDKFLAECERLSGVAFPMG